MDVEQKRMLEELLFSGEKKLSFAKLLFLEASMHRAFFPFPNHHPRTKRLQIGLSKRFEPLR